MFSSVGYEFQPRHSIQLILITTARSRIICSATCNEQPACHTFDYDSASGRCRLFEADQTVGSIIASTSLTSVVGNVLILQSQFDHTYNQSCEACQEDRYQYCSINGSTCQCRPHTFWNGSVCLLQLFENDTCSQIDACRTDFNLTCATEYGQFSVCASAFTIIQPNITTVAGFYNGSCPTSSTNLTVLHDPGGIAVSNNGTLYVGDGSPANVLLAFEPNNLTAKQLFTYGNWPTYLFVGPVTSSIYATVLELHTVVIWPSNQTIPKNPSASCSDLLHLYYPTGIAVDFLGNIYVSSYYCNRVTKWNSNGTNATLVAGSLSATSGSDSQHLYSPYGLFLDEMHSLLYVADAVNNRVQRFALGNLTGVTVAGGNGQGTASNQLNFPSAIHVSQVDNSYYICDYHNHRIQKWVIGATYGVTIAGSSTGVAGSALNLLNGPYDIWVDPNATYVLISDANNCRVQKYLLY
ncbi:unnamed protein product [Adineta steineri]|uniref:Apple domain-containing protein n=1 Tax=Adineta steineri TaxID=433720 RepID=A0A818VN80_9BILA|nr:unnamed protein product [Adineta steineri]CAF1179553.1 unnamed protein product [Adineta steineri]CAF3711913.1 unnamed protein product [Adineta steineri]CAF3819672.1 unnamed protein product [Adineta steineri]CAF4113867.1 unnamed protein product [Adineta steineri]